MSKRQQVVSSIIQLFESVQIVNGYSTDVGTRVYDSRRRVLSKDEVPCIVVWDSYAERILEQACIGQDAYSVTIDAVIFFPSKTEYTEARSAMSDIVAVIGSDPMLGGLCMEPIEVTHTNLPVSNKTEASELAHIRMQVKYTTSLYSI